MYCRKCGARISMNAVFCESCGAEVVKVDENKCTKENKNKKSKREKKLENLKNKDILPGTIFSILAFLIAIFPYQKSWGIGTSLWLRIIILILALIGAYFTTRAKKLNNLYEIQYKYQVKPNLVKVSYILSTITIIASLFAFIML